MYAVRRLIRNPPRSRLGAHASFGARRERLVTVTHPALTGFRGWQIMTERAVSGNATGDYRNAERMRRVTRKETPKIRRSTIYADHRLPRPKGTTA